MLSSSAESLEDACDVSTWLHRNDTKLILLVNPHQESLIFVMEDTSTSWPVSVETAGLKESISLFEEEVIFDELLLDIWFHAEDWIEGTLEIALEGIASLHDLGHDFFSLSLAYSWTEWVALQVSAHSDSRRVHHSALLLGEVSVLKTVGLHA